MPDYDEIIKQSQANVKSLSEKLAHLDRLLQDITEVKESGKAIPELFEKKYQDLTKLSADYTNILGETTKTYIDGNNVLFTGNLGILSDKIKTFETEITRLRNTDLTQLFQDLQKVFIEQARGELSAELLRFSDMTKELQSEIDALKSEIERLKRIDLERPFDKLQKTLSEIFGAINGMNGTLTNLIQTLTGLVQAISTVQTTTEANHKEVMRLLRAVSEGTEEHLVRQDREAATMVQLLESKMQSVAEQSEMLGRGIRTNRLLLVTLIFVAIIIGILLAFRH